MVREHVPRARIARAGVRADQTVGRERRLQHRRRDVPLDEVGRRARKRGARRVVDLGLARIVALEGVVEDAAQAFGFEFEFEHPKRIVAIERGDLARVLRDVAAD